MTYNFGTTAQGTRYKVGILRESSISEEVTRTISDFVKLTPVEASELKIDKPTLDALVFSLNDAPFVPKMYHTPTIFVGTENERHLISPYIITGLSPVHTNGGETIDLKVLEKTFPEIMEKVNYVRAAERIFPGECAADLALLQETMSEGSVPSLFDLYHRFCKGIIKDAYEKMSGLVDREAAKEIRNKLALFGAQTNDTKLLNDLFEQGEAVGLVRVINRLIESEFGKVLFRDAQKRKLLAGLLALFSKEIKDAPMGYEVHEHAHTVWHVPGSSTYVKHADGGASDSIRHEAKVLMKMNSYLRRIQDNLGEKEEFNLTIPSVLFIPPKRVADEGKYDVMVISQLPGEQLATYVASLHRQMKKYQASGDTARLEEAKNEFCWIKDGALDACARTTALAYVIAKLEEENPELVRRTHSSDPAELKRRLESRFLGHQSDDEKFRGLSGGVRKAFGSRLDKNIEVYESTILANIDPILEIISGSSPGIDTDRSIQNMLYVKGSTPCFPQLDFETFRNDSLVRAWVHTALLLGPYHNGKRKMQDDFFYDDPKKPLFEKDSEESWHRVAIFDFLKRVQNYAGIAKRAIARSGYSEAKNIRVVIPTAENAEKEFYADSCYRGAFFFGFFERYRELRKNEIDVLDHCQHMAIENAAVSADVLNKRFLNSHYSVRLLRDSFGQLHDFIVTRERTL